MTDIITSAKTFQAALRKIRESHRPAQGNWYPHDSLSAVMQQIGPLLTDTLLEGTRDLPLLELGCGDGDLAFFFESLGYPVTAVDYPLTNCNQMQGVHALKAQLNSAARIQAADLDGRFQISGGPFGLTLLMGVLYHLKNPFYLLEYAAQRSRYCILTTRIAQRTPQGMNMRDEPLSYLVDPTELSGDCTNYWIFSESGLKRLISRAGWTIQEFTTTGCRERSDLTPARDERACCLLQSRITMQGRLSLGAGWHDIEEGTFRWTAKRFAAQLNQEVRPGAKLVFRFNVVPELAGNPVTLSPRANGTPLPPQSFSGAGEHTYLAALPEYLHGADRLHLEFVTDQAVQSSADHRELSLVVDVWKEGLELSDDNIPLGLTY